MRRGKSIHAGWPLVCPRVGWKARVAGGVVPRPAWEGPDERGWRRGPLDLCVLCSYNCVNSDSHVTGRPAGCLESCAIVSSVLASHSQKCLGWAKSILWSPYPEERCCLHLAFIGGLRLDQVGLLGVSVRMGGGCDEQKVAHLFKHQDAICSPLRTESVEIASRSTQGCLVGCWSPLMVHMNRCPGSDRSRQKTWRKDRAWLVLVTHQQPTGQGGNPQMANCRPLPARIL